eukprot:GILI01017646.1.p1 GENE.GILI01017646.1~~GILI01017646.1.p1  ORF type:complete len:254 (-),score=5.21 GILI01017646.1:523-1284(-)
MGCGMSNTSDKISPGNHALHLEKTAAAAREKLMIAELENTRRKGERMLTRQVTALLQPITVGDAQVSTQKVTLKSEGGRKPRSISHSKKIFDAPTHSPQGHLDNYVHNEHKQVDLIMEASGTNTTGGDALFGRSLFGCTEHDSSVSIECPALPVSLRLQPMQSCRSTTDIFPRILAVCDQISPTLPYHPSKVLPPISEVSPTPTVPSPFPHPCGEPYCSLGNLEHVGSELRLPWSVFTSEPSSPTSYGLVPVS